MAALGKVDDLDDHLFGTEGIPRVPPSLEFEIYGPCAAIAARWTCSCGATGKWAAENWANDIYRVRGWRAHVRRAT